MKHFYKQLRKNVPTELWEHLHCLISKKNKSDTPDEVWNDIDLPDPKEKKNVKLSKRQIVVENILKKEMIKQWDHIFNIAVEK